MGGCHGGWIKGFTLRLDDDPQRKIVFFGELEVTLIVGRNRHDGAGSVIGQHEVGQVHGHADLGQGVDAVGAGKYALFFVIIGGAFAALGCFDLFDETLNLFPSVGGCQLTGQPVFRGQGHERRPEQRVLAGGKDLD